MLPSTTRKTFAVLLTATVCSGFGCRRTAPPGVSVHADTDGAAITTAPTSGFTTGPATRPAKIAFGGPKLGIALDYPGTWGMQKNPDYELVIVPPNVPKGRSISVDVPDLPMHIPGLIPIGSVQSGYVDDVKKQFGNVQVAQLTAPAMAKTSSRFVRCQCKSGGTDIVEIALLAVHADRVYILRATTDAAGEADMRAVLDAIIASIRWVKQ